MIRYVFLFFSIAFESSQSHTIVSQDPNLKCQYTSVGFIFRPGIYTTTVVPSVLDVPYLSTAFTVALQLKWQFHKDSPAITSATHMNILVAAKKEIAKLDLFKTDNSFKFSHQMRCSPNIQRYLKSHSNFIDSSCIQVKCSMRLKRHILRYQQTPASTIFFFND